MNTRAIKKPTAFRLDEELINRLKEEAKKANRSLNNFVECILMDSVYHEPNEETKAAFEEAKTGKYAGKIDMKDFNAFMDSVNEIE